MTLRSDNTSTTAIIVPGARFERIRYAPKLMHLGSAALAEQRTKPWHFDAPPPPKRPGRLILHTVAARSDLTPAQLTGRSRRRHIIHWRFVCAWMVYRYTEMSLPAVGTLLGDRDHTTILHAVNCVENAPERYAGDIAAVAEDCGLDAPKGAA